LWALLALVSSVALNRFHRLRTTDVNVKPSALRELPVPRALVESPGALAGLARMRAAASSEGMSDPIAFDRRIDALVYRLFALPPALVEACERGFWGERFAVEFQRLDPPMSDPPARMARREETA
jgi:hypothetical protein